MKILASAICISPDGARCHFEFQRQANRIRTGVARSQLVQKYTLKLENKLASQELTACNGSFAWPWQTSRREGAQEALQFWGYRSGHWALCGYSPYCLVLLHINQQTECTMPEGQYMLSGMEPLCPPRLGHLGHGVLSRWR